MTGFNPKYSITNKIKNNLLEIEKVKDDIKDLPINPRLLSSLRKSARLSTIHYSTQIEGNRLTKKEVKDLIENKNNKPIKARVRDEKEIKGYYTAFDYIEKLAKDKTEITQDNIKQIHALVMGSGTTKIKKSEYRDRQNVIIDSSTSEIVYMPPEANDVNELMEELVEWINKANDIPIPIKAAIVHYQFVTIHPYFDGNGRSARLLTTLLLYKYGYSLNGIYSLEEYYAKDLKGYYEALTVGKSHNYYLGRINANITKWIEYFIQGMAIAFKAVYKKAKENSVLVDAKKLLRELDTKQRQILDLFENQKYITTADIAQFFNFSPRSARLLALEWVKSGFLIALGQGKKRKYQLCDKFEKMLET